jgi:hypothetical protein
MTDKRYIMCLIKCPNEDSLNLTFNSSWVSDVVHKKNFNIYVIFIYIWIIIISVLSSYRWGNEALDSIEIEFFLSTDQLSTFQESVCTIGLFSLCVIAVESSVEHYLVYYCSVFYSTLVYLLLSHIN